MLIFPARCTSAMPENLDKPHLVAETKMDGARYVLYLGTDPYERQSGNALLSRTVSIVDNKHVDRTGNVPHITDLEYEGLEGTVLDGEAFLIDLATTTSIMGSGPAVARQKQKLLGKITYYAFDIPVFRGKDIRGLPLEKRRKVLREVLARMNNPHIVLIDQWSAVEAHDRFSAIVNEGGEGLIIKDLRMGYGVGWSKMKKSYEVSCFISGFKAGREGGKFADSVGSVELSVFTDKGERLAVGFAAGFGHDTYAEMAKNPDAFIGKVVDVYAHELSSGSRLRSPTFFRFRDDYDLRECTLSKLKADLSVKAKSKRVRY